MVFVSLGVAENFDSACQSCLGGSNGLNDMTNFSRSFFEASGKEGFGDGAETEASSVELLGESDRERGGDFGGADAVTTEGRGEEFGVRVLFWA